MAAWTIAMESPEVVDRLVVLNAPHPIAGIRELSAEQALRSWYVVFFQLPWIPELLLKAGEFRALKETYREGSERPDAVDDDDVRRFVRAIARPGALTSALDYYRAFFRETVRENLPGAIPFVGTSRRSTPRRWCCGVNADRPERVNEAIRAFLDLDR